MTGFAQVKAARSSRRTARRRHPGRHSLAGIAVAATSSILLVGCSSSGSSVARPPSAAHIAATVTRSAAAWTVSWTAAGTPKVKVYDGSTATDATNYIGDGQGSGSLTVTETPGVSREWFRLVPDNGETLAVTDRDLGLASVPNFRDIGGYRTTSGDWVRMGVVYRSQALSPVSAADLADIRQLGITDVYDLRTPAEASGNPDSVPPGATYHLVNVFGTTGPEVDFGSTALQAQQGMMAMNKQFVTGAADRAAVGTLITDIADSTGAQLYNCTAGKDRTGWATAVILTLLGVPQPTVMKDYLLSNTYYFDSPAVQDLINTSSPSHAAYLTAILDVNPTYLEAGLNQVTNSYGSMYNYAVKGAGVSPAVIVKLRDRLLVS